MDDANATQADLRSPLRDQGAMMGETAGGGEGMDAITQERLVSHCPIVVRRRTSWGECDPAGVVYTPRFSDYLVAAYSWFDRVVLAKALAASGRALSTPMKALSLEFHHVLRPGDLFDMEVSVAAVRTKTFDVEIMARAMDGGRRFAGRLTPIFVDEAFRSVAMPSDVAEALRSYRRQSEAAA